VEPERRQWGAWNFVGFWIADSFNINTWMISSSNIVDGLSWWQSWICVWVRMLSTLPVASFADRYIARLLYRSLLRVHDRSNRCHLPYFFPCRQSRILWSLGCFMARIQPCSNGLHLVRRAGVDWRYLRLPNDTLYLEQLARCVYPPVPQGAKLTRTGRR
jgi:hypothetical protein